LIIEQILFSGRGMEAELPVAVLNSVSFESMLSRMWKMEMNRHHMQKFNIHFTGGNTAWWILCMETWKQWLFIVRIIRKTRMHHVDKIQSFCC